MATDQLLIALEDTPVSLERVPAFVLSEVTRDVDLFVAVAGVGSDPNWYDGGPAGRSVSTGRGTVSATSCLFSPIASCSTSAGTPAGETRREVLAELIPRLAIAALHLHQEFPRGARRPAHVSHSLRLGQHPHRP
jgi:hypothetical protein